MTSRRRSRAFTPARLRRRALGGRPLGALLAAALLAALAGGREPSARDVAAALGRLDAASAAERAAAERELARTVTEADLPLLAAAARSGSVEVRARIASALESDARLFALAAELMSSAEPRVAATGAEAIAGHAAAWLGASDQEPRSMASVAREFKSAYEGEWRLDVGGDLEEALDRMARLLDVRHADFPNAPPPPIVLDPRFDPADARPHEAAEALPPVAVGGLYELLFTAAVRHGAVFDVYCWGEGRAWILVRTGPIEAGEPAQVLLARWVLEARKSASPAQARAAARALAASGWPAAIAWLDGRWRKERDAAAFAGLTLSASRGAVPSSLATRDGAALLLERADRALAVPGAPLREPAEWARALRAIGPLGAEAWAAGWAAAPPRGKSLRCALVASARTCPPALAELLRARWSSPEVQAEERGALLAALAALGVSLREAPAATGIEAALDWAAARGRGRELLAELRATGVSEPASWASGRGVLPAALVELCADALERRAQEPDLGERWRALIESPRGEELALRLLDRESLWTSRADRRRALEAARAAGAAPEALARLAALAGLATPAELEAQTKELFARATWTVSDWRLAGAIVGREGGELELWPQDPDEPDVAWATFLQRLGEVRDAILAAQSKAASGSSPLQLPPELAGMEAGWVQGCARALVALLAQDGDPGATELRRRLRVLFQRAQHPLRLELIGDRFPPPSPAVRVDVASREPWIGF